MGAVKYWMLVFASTVMVVAATPFIFVYFQARGFYFGCVNTWHYVSGFIGQVKHDLRYHWSGYVNSERSTAGSGAKADQDGDPVHGRSDPPGDSD